MSRLVSEVLALATPHGQQLSRIRPREKASRKNIVDTPTNHKKTQTGRPFIVEIRNLRMSQHGSMWQRYGCSMPIPP